MPLLLLPNGTPPCTLAKRVPPSVDNSGSSRPPPLPAPLPADIDTLTLQSMRGTCPQGPLATIKATLVFEKDNAVCDVATCGVRPFLHPQASPSPTQPTNQCVNNPEGCRGGHTPISGTGLLIPYLSNPFLDTTHQPLRCADLLAKKACPEPPETRVSAPYHKLPTWGPMDHHNDE